MRVNRVGFTLGAVLLALLMSVNAFAAVNVTIQSSKDQVAVGEAFDITITGTATAGESIAAGAFAINFTPTTATVTGVTSGFTFAILPSGAELTSSPMRPGLLDMTGTGAAVGTDKVIFTIACTGAAVGDATFEFNIEATETNELIDTNGANVLGTLGTAKTVTVVANRNPAATDGTLATDEDTPKDGTMTATDADGDALTFTVTTPPTKGTVKINDAAKGTFTYTPNPNENGTDNFVFEATDPKGGKGQASVSITITAVNDAPVAEAGTLEVTEDVTATGTLVATDPEGDKLTFSIATQPTKGVVTIKDAAAGTYEYVPTKDANGADEFTFTADDGKLKATGKITVTIAAVNDKPVAEAGKATWVLSDPATFTGKLVGTDVDGDVLAYKIVTQPTQGTVTVDATGAYTFAPKDAKPGPDTFTFTVNDGKVDSEPATIEVAIESGAHTLTVKTSPAAGGKVKPSGAVVVEDGKAQDFTTTANEGYFAYSARVVWADGTKTFTKIADNKFTVKDVKQDGTLTVNFKAQYTITLSATPAKGGVCDPMGPEKLVNGGDDQIITVTANKGFMIEEVKIDGVAATIADDTSKTFTHTFTAVAANHTVDVVFESTGEYHSGDTDMDSAVSMPELLRVIQLFNLNMGQYVCDGTTEDGYASGNDAAKRTCMQHSADSDDDWTFSLSELLRVIQFWSLGGYHKATPADEGFPTKDGFAPGK